jgi:hypothetical protein
MWIQTHEGHSLNIMYGHHGTGDFSHVSVDFKNSCESVKSEKHVCTLSMLITRPKSRDMQEYRHNYSKNINH